MTLGSTRAYAECVADALALLPPRASHTPAQQAAVDMLLTHNVDILCLLTTHDPVFVETQQAMTLFLSSGAPSFTSFLDFFLTVCGSTSDSFIAALASRVRGHKCHFCYCLMHRFRTVSAFAVFMSMRALWRRLHNAPAPGPYSAHVMEARDRDMEGRGAGVGGGVSWVTHHDAHPSSSSSSQHHSSTSPLSSATSVVLITADVRAVASTSASSSVHAAMERIALWRTEDERESWRAAGTVHGSQRSQPAVASSLLFGVHLVVDSDETMTLMQCIEEREHTLEASAPRQDAADPGGFAGPHGPKTSHSDPTPSASAPLRRGTSDGVLRQTSIEEHRTVTPSVFTRGFTGPEGPETSHPVSTHPPTFARAFSGSSVHEASSRAADSAHPHVTVEQLDASVFSRGFVGVGLERPFQGPTGPMNGRASTQKEPQEPQSVAAQQRRGNHDAPSYSKATGPHDTQTSQRAAASTHASTPPLRRFADDADAFV